MNEPIDEDRRSRDEALRRVGRQVAIWLLPILAAAFIATALGIPWWIVGAVVVFFVYLLLFEA